MVCGRARLLISLLLVDTSHATKGTALVELYAKRGPEIADRLPPRTDGLTNLKGIGVLQWSDLAAVLRESGDSAPRSANARMRRTPVCLS